MRFSLPVFYLLGLMISFISSADEFPVAPLSRVQTEPWGESFRLSNRNLEVIIHPESDGVVSLRKTQGNNLLNRPVTLLPGSPEDLTEALPRLDGVAQPRWQARGWISSEGSQTVLLTQTFGPPIHLRITHLLSLPQTGSTLQWTTRFTAIAPIDPLLPITLILSAEAAQWEGLWKIENGPELKTNLEQRQQPDGLLVQQTLPDQAALQDLPPQGWTLVIEGSLSLPSPE